MDEARGAPATPAREAPSGELRVGDLLELRHGPFAARWIVIETIDAGARLAFDGHVWFEGYQHTLGTSGGVKLTESTEHAFLGRAHWPAAKVLGYRPSTGER